MMSTTTIIEMEEERCFVCNQKIVGKSYFSYQSQENSEMLCQILKIKIPHLGESDCGESGLSFENINYCRSCVDRIKIVRDMLTELERLEKQVSEETHNIQLQLKEIYDTNYEKNLNDKQNNFSLEFRAAIINELKSIESKNMPGSNIEKKKYIDQNHISERRDSIVTNRNSTDLSLNMNSRKNVTNIPEPFNNDGDNHNDCLVRFTEHDPVVKLEVIESEYVSYESPYPVENNYNDDEHTSQDPIVNVNSCNLRNKVDQTSIVQGEEPSISGDMNVSKEIKSKGNVSHTSKTIGSTSKTKKSFICETCDMSFDDTYTLKNHCRSHNEEKLPEETLQRILRPRTSIKIIIKPSTTTKKSAKISEQVLQHTTVNKKEEIGTHKCQHCERTFKNIGHVKCHERRMHTTGGTPYTCKYCNQIFTSRPDLKRHKATHTAADKGLKCQYCETIFKNRTELKKHERVVHKILDKEFMCGQCGKTFLDGPGLRSHERTHTGEKPFTCQFCGQNFANKKTVKTHELTHTGEKPFKCQFCEKTFRHLHNRKKHERAAHTGVTPYKCQYCEKPFTNGSNAKRHELTHTQERPHECRCCGKKFPTMTDVKVHMRTHPGEKPYKCQYCELQFSYWNIVKEHERSYHADIPITNLKPTFCSS